MSVIFADLVRFFCEQGLKDSTNVVGTRGKTLSKSTGTSCLQTVAQQKENANSRLLESVKEQDVVLVRITSLDTPDQSAVEFIMSLHSVSFSSCSMLVFCNGLISCGQPQPCIIVKIFINK